MSTETLDILTGLRRICEMRLECPDIPRVERDMYRRRHDALTRAIDAVDRVECAVAVSIDIRDLCVTPRSAMNAAPHTPYVTAAYGGRERLDALLNLFPAHLAQEGGAA